MITTLRLSGALARDVLGWPPKGPFGPNGFAVGRVCPPGDPRWGEWVSIKVKSWRLPLATHKLTCSVRLLS